MATLKKYPLDLTGSLPANRVAGETRQIVHDEERYFIPAGGPFYTKSLKVWSQGQLLSPNIDYKALDLNRDATLASGKEVCNVIYLSKSTTDFVFQYQVIGGEYLDLTKDVLSFIQNTPLNQIETLEWGSVLYKPTTFPPADHTHVLTDWRGYGEACALLAEMQNAIATTRHGAKTLLETEARFGIENTVETWIQSNGTVHTEELYFKGDGNSPATQVRLDQDKVYEVLDARYARNVMSPLSRVGIVGTTTLPIVADTGFAIRITDTLPVNIAGIQGSIAPQVLSLTDSSYSNVTDPSSRTIFAYVILELGQPRFYFSTSRLTDDIYTVYIGKVGTDAIGVAQLLLAPVSRIDSYRPLNAGRGSSFSVSDGTADASRKLNWDADVPPDSVSAQDLPVKWSISLSVSDFDAFVPISAITAYADEPISSLVYAVARPKWSRLAGQFPTVNFTFGDLDSIGKFQVNLNNPSLSENWIDIQPNVGYLTNWINGEGNFAVAVRLKPGVFYSGNRWIKARFAFEDHVGASGNLNYQAFEHRSPEAIEVKWSAVPLTAANWGSADELDIVPSFDQFYLSIIYMNVQTGRPLTVSPFGDNSQLEFTFPGQSPLVFAANQERDFIPTANQGGIDVWSIENIPVRLTSIARVDFAANARARTDTSSWVTAGGLTAKIATAPITALWENGSSNKTLTDYNEVELTITFNDLLVGETLVIPLGQDNGNGNNRLQRLEDATWTNIPDDQSSFNIATRHTSRNDNVNKVEKVKFRYLLGSHAEGAVLSGAARALSNSAVYSSPFYLFGEVSNPDVDAVISKTLMSMTDYPALKLNDDIAYGSGTFYLAVYYRDLSIDGRIHIQSMSPSVQLEYFNGTNWILMGGSGELVSLFEVERPILGTVDMTNILFRVAASTPEPSSATPFSLLVQHFSGDASTLAVANFVPAVTP